MPAFGVAAMSSEAISRALNLTPVLADLGGQPPSASWFVLVSLAITES
ncbi:MAG TPA: hypothetical protein VGQ26_04450 [Streptosporangiaceae bacterium]|jgi:hypothetical protein|nr:hypothetical protein [Streptosporangiaceae bacterium]